MGHPSQCIDEQRATRPDQVRPLNVGLPGCRADGDPPATLSDPAEPGHTVDVDEERWRYQSQVHQGDKALPARQHAGLVGPAPEGLERLVDRGRRDVVELGWFHRYPPWRTICSARRRPGPSARDRTSTHLRRELDTVSIDMPE
jgi:hypothetical protein